MDEIVGKASEGRPIAADLESIDLAVEAAFCLERVIQNASIYHRYRYWTSPWYRLVYRWRLIDTKQTESIEQCIKTVDSLIDHHDFQHLLIRMGKGSPSHRNRLLNAMLQQGYVVELVDERKPLEDSIETNTVFLLSVLRP